MQDLAALAASHYDLPNVQEIKLINLSENATFKVEAPDGKRWALRIHRDGYHSREAIASELAWLIDIRERGVVVTPKPVRGRNGEIIQDVMHPNLGLRRVVLSEWEQGSEPGIGQDLTKPFEVLGEVTARMHNHARLWQRPNFFTWLTWNFETSLGDHRKLKNIRTNRNTNRQTFGSLWKIERTLWPHSLRLAARQFIDRW
jgi:Ser/Thr protein kinase RdoA (MazF antagonist)